MTYRTHEGAERARDRFAAEYGEAGYRYRIVEDGRGWLVEVHNGQGIFLTYV